MTDRVDPGHLDIHDELAVAWALHTLEPDDERAYARHLADCPRCAVAVAEAEETLGLLGAAVTPLEPPPRLRQRLMDAVAEDEAATPTSGNEIEPPREDDGPTPGAPRHAKRDDEPVADVVPLASRRRQVSRLVLAAAVVVAVAVVGGLAVANQQLRAERDAEAAAAAENARVVEVLRDAGTPGVAHASLADPQGAMVGLVVDTGTGPRMVATALEPNPGDHTYVLWGLAGGTPTALGTFDVPGPAPVVSSVPSGGEATPYGAYAVSLEPGRTAPASPTEIVASGQVGR
jgi:hypothetical protein